MKNTIIGLTLSAFMLFGLTGCLDKRDVMQNQAPTISHPLTKPDLDGVKAEVVDLVGKRMDTSENAIQTNMQSLLGVSVGKVTDDFVKLQAQFKNMAELNTNFTNKMESRIGEIKTDLNASVASNNDLRIMLKAQMDLNAQLVANIKITAQFQSDMQAKLEALGAAQAGVNNKIEQQTNELKQQMTAGRDVTTNNNQFTKEVLQAIESVNQTSSKTSSQWAWVMTGIISALSGLGMAYMHSQKKSSDTRAAKAEERSIESHKKVERALMVMTGTTVPTAPTEEPKA